MALKAFVKTKRVFDIEGFYLITCLIFNEGLENIGVYTTLGFFDDNPHADDEGQAFAKLMVKSNVECEIEIYDEDNDEHKKLQEYFEVIKLNLISNEYSIFSVVRTLMTPEIGITLENLNFLREFVSLKLNKEVDWSNYITECVDKEYKSIVLEEGTTTIDLSDLSSLSL